jgi:hypothetical protein
MKKQLLIIIALLISISSFAKFVSQNEANIIAVTFFSKQYLHINNIQLTDIQIENTIPVKYHQQIVYYIVNIKNHGFVQISAEDAAYPILAFDLDQNVNTEINVENYNNWVESYKKQIEYIRINNLPASTKIEHLWTDLRNSNSNIAGGKSVDPLLLSTWNQDALYNAQCPEDVNGPGGRVYAGCVAIAMAQIMYYYRYPMQGSGSHSYYHNVYGTQSANFGNTTYKWNQMTNTISSSGNSEIAQLLYHLGVSVNMGYSASGSGAYSGVAANALKLYFNYQSSVELKNKDDFTYNQWVDMITTSLDNKIPLYYHGFDNQGGGGHAFNLDGYQGSDHFHFNWGWSGSYNGYYYLSALNPGSSNFINGQGAIFNIYPGSGYPYSCSTGNISTSNEGTIADGSGPQMYDNNLDCNWLIDPTENISHIKISFDRFDLMPGDTLFIYDRYINDSLIGAYSGSQIPPPINTEHGACYLNFKTDSTQKGSGFSISYKSYYPVYCSGVSYHTDSTGVLADGSDTNDYNNSTFCRWLIEPSNAYPVRIYFDSFDTESNKDFVKIYDTDHSPAILLANYSGHNIPPSVTSNSGKMSIIFTSSSGQTFGGWSAHYVSGPSVGIEENNKSIFKIYPNPSSGNFIIENTSNNNINKMTILGIDGREIMQINAESNKSLFNINLSNLSSGIYFIKIQSDKYDEIQKIIIK